MMGLNWLKIIKFSAILFVTSFLIGMAEGFAVGISANYLSMAVYVGTVVSLATDITVFVFLAKGLEEKPFQHAIVALILTIVVGFVLLLLLSGSFTLSGIATNVALDILALVFGTSIGVNMRARNAGSESA